MEITTTGAGPVVIVNGEKMRAQGWSIHITAAATPATDWAVEPEPQPAATDTADEKGQSHE